MPHFQQRFGVNFISKVS